MEKKKVRQVDIASLLSGISYSVYKSILSIEDIPDNIITDEDKVFILERLKETCDEGIERLSKEPSRKEVSVEKLLKTLASMTGVIQKEIVSEEILPIKEVAPETVKEDIEAEVIAEILIKLNSKFHLSTARSVLRQIKQYKGDTPEIKNIKTLINEFSDTEALEFIKRLCLTKK